MNNQQITVKDIARILNLHHTTVSKALRNHPDIRQETKELVFTTAKELDYHPNSLAKSLRNRRSQTIGVIVPTIKNDFFSTVISGIEEVAYREDHNIIVCQSHETVEREILNVSSMVSNLVAGLLISVSQTTRSGDHFRIFEKRKIPLVFFDRVCEDITASKVVADDYQGAFEAVEHLIQSGRWTIAHFSGPETISVSRHRRKGYTDALLRNNLPVDDGWIIQGGFLEEDGSRAFQQVALRGKLPEAVFAVNDPVAIGAYHQIKRLGLRIPEDIALVGFGDNILSSYLNPPLTTVKQSPYELGKISAEIILEQIKNPSEMTNPREEIVKTHLIVRDSTQKTNKGAVE